VSDFVLEKPPLVTLTLFGFGTASAKAWAFAQMGLAGGKINQTNNLRFWKLLGTGDGGGFSLRPDLARYGFFGVWEAAMAADEFLSESPVMKNYRRRATEVWTVKLLPTKSHGNWSGKNPFLPLAEKHAAKPIAVLTRATIRFAKLHRFWAHVPATSREINQAENLIASIGIGEAPFFRQATFSIWRDEAAMQKFAYQSAFHRAVIKKTREENWYKEELFARFAPISSEGSWNGRDPLAEFLK
jgi:hypothetical protein